MARCWSAVATWMQGYYRDPQAAAAAIVDGWLHTGDIGEVDAAGFLRITDRKNEIFKTSTGKWISPARIEANVKRSMYVANAMVLGSGRPYPIALSLAELAPRPSRAPGALRGPTIRPARGARRRPGLPGARGSPPNARPRELRTDPPSHRRSPRLYRRRRRASPSMKVKRRVVEARYADEIEAAYGGELPVHAAL